MSVEIRDSKVSTAELLNKLRQSADSRKELVSASDEAAVGEQRLLLRAAIERLRVKTESYGKLEPASRSSAGGLSYLVKKAVRKVIQRHLDQQREVNESLLEVLDQLTLYLERQNRP